MLVSVCRQYLWVSGDVMCRWGVPKDRTMGEIGLRYSLDVP